MELVFWGIVIGLLAVAGLEIRAARDRAPHAELPQIATGLVLLILFVPPMGAIALLGHVLPAHLAVPLGSLVFIPGALAIGSLYLRLLKIPSPGQRMTWRGFYIGQAIVLGYAPAFSQLGRLTIAVCWGLALVCGVLAWREHELASRT